MASSSNEVICDMFSWGTGNGIFRLLDDQGQVGLHLQSGSFGCCFVFVCYRSSKSGGCLIL